MKYNCTTAHLHYCAWNSHEQEKKYIDVGILGSRRLDQHFLNIVFVAAGALGLQ